jgi:hypothetical protein
MGDILKAIYDDTQDYLALCSRYGEKPVVDQNGVDPYSQHARKLKDREYAEWKSQNKEKKG